MKNLTYIILIGLLLSSCETQEKGNPMRIVENKLQRQISKSKTPGLQYYFFNTDSLIFRYEGGMSDIANQKKVTEETTFNAYSVTKTFTALAVLQLAEKGLLILDDPISKYLPDFPYPETITIRQLLAHSSGIPNPMPLNWVHFPDENDTFDSKQFFSEIFEKNKKVKSEPNKKLAYTNLGYIFLGRLIEKVSGQKYTDYITENIIAKIGLSSDELGFAIQDTSLQSKGYIKTWSFKNLVLNFMLGKSKLIDGTEGSWTAYKHLYVNGPSYGGLIGSGNTFVKYLQELLKVDNLLISESYKQQLFTENVLSNGKRSGMCLSWYKGKLNEHTYYAHAGGGFFYCEIRLYPDLERGSVIMFNRSGMSDERILDDFDKSFLTKNNK